MQVFSHTLLSHEVTRASFIKFNMRILITGAGFIGSHLAESFLDMGFPVDVTHCGKTKYNQVATDRFDQVDLRPYDCVFHLAAIVDSQSTDEQTIMEVNYFRALDLLRRAGDLDIPVVCASSCAVYGRRDCVLTEDLPMSPIAPYAVSKARLEQDGASLAQVAFLRFSNVYGEGEQSKGKCRSMVSQIRDSVSQGQAPRLFRWGEQVRDWVHVSDVVRACILSSGQDGVFNVGSGVSCSFNDIVKYWTRAYKKDGLRPVFIDCPFQESYQDATRVSITKIQEALGF